MDQEEVATNGVVVKGKRTKRHRPNATPSAASSESAATATSCRIGISTDEEEDMANCLIMLAQGRRFPEKFTSRKFREGAGGYYVYECKTCFKSFSSFQALGGHRASHKKPKLALAKVALSDEDDATLAKVVIGNNLSLQLTNQDLYKAATVQGGGPKQRVHECSICGAEFGSGQALGGHMRRHRGPTAALTVQEASPSTSSAVDPTKKPSLDLDLNLPAMPEIEEVNGSSEVSFSGKQPPAPAQQIVFSPPPALVDCHY